MSKEQGEYFRILNQAGETLRSLAEEKNPEALTTIQRLAQSAHGPNGNGPTQMQGLQGGRAGVEPDRDVWQVLRGLLDVEPDRDVWQVLRKLVEEDRERRRFLERTKPSRTAGDDKPNEPDRDVWQIIDRVVERARRWRADATTPEPELWQLVDRLMAADQKTLERIVNDLGPQR